MISNVFSKRLRNKKIAKKQDNDINPDILLIEKYQSLLGENNKEDLVDDEDDEEHEADYREDVIFATEQKHYDDDDEDEEINEEQKHARAESDIDEVFLETKSKTKNNAQAHAELKNHVANKLNRIISKNKTMLSEGNLLQKRTDNLLSGIKKNLA